MHKSRGIIVARDAIALKRVTRPVQEAFVPDGDMAEEQGEEFHLHDVLVTFKACLSQDNELRLDEYLRGWKALIK